MGLLFEVRVKDVQDWPVTRAVAGQHQITWQEVEALLERHEVSPDLVEELLLLATRTHRDLNLHGAKRDYDRAVEKALRDHSGGAE